MLSISESYHLYMSSYCPSFSPASIGALGIVRAVTDVTDAKEKEQITCKENTMV